MSDYPVVVAVSGVKNSGKTTFLENILPLLHEKGVRVGVIKHDGHDFTPDVPGTDSYRLNGAGAQSVAVYSSSCWMLVRKNPVELETLLEHMRDMDLVLLEGQKNSRWPKIELVRGAVSHKSVCRPETLLALATDTDVAVAGIPTLPLNGYREAVELLMEYIKK